MRRLTLITAGLAVVALAGCSSSSSSPAASSSSSAPATGTITVFAAASLTEAFTQIGKQFEAAHKGELEGPGDGQRRQARPAGKRQSLNMAAHKLAHEAAQPSSRSRDEESDGCALSGARTLGVGPAQPAPAGNQDKAHKAQTSGLERRLPGRLLA